MYGLILEGIAEAVRRKFGEEAWNDVRQKAGIKQINFIVHKTYSETVVPRLVKAASDVSGRPQDELTEMFGITFVNYVGKYGYDRIMRVLGRNLRDFINGLDNLHEYLRFSYAKLKPPSFFCENESRHGLTLHYRSKRRGFLYYVMGQLTQVARVFYNTPVEIELITEEETLDMTHVVLKLHFDNVGFKEEGEGEEAKDAKNQQREELSIRSEMFFDVFPFHVVFNQGMEIKSIGTGLEAIMPHVLGQCVDEMFTLSRPLIEFTMDNVVMHANNVFEIISMDTVKKTTTNTGTSTESQDEDDGDDADNKQRRLKMKGQMIYMDEWEAIMFLGTPVMENLDKMFETGLFINDLSMHDSSRDLVMAGTQQGAELRMALDQGQQKAKKLEDTMANLKKEHKRMNTVLYNSVPRLITNKLQNGDTTQSICQSFNNVSVLVSEIADMGKTCSGAEPHLVILMMNQWITEVNKLANENQVFKMDNLGDSFMFVSGAPVETNYHACYICDMGLDMIKHCEDVVNPATKGYIQIRVGINSGAAVGGLVGVKAPRYAFWGDTVTTTTRMETQGASGFVHITEATKKEIGGHPFEVQDAGSIEAACGSTVATFWLTGKTVEGSVAKSKDSAKVVGMRSGFTLDGEEIDTSDMYKPVAAEV